MLIWHPQNLEPKPLKQTQKPSQKLMYVQPRSAFAQEVFEDYMNKLHSCKIEEEKESKNDASFFYKGCPPQILSFAEEFQKTTAICGGLSKNYRNARRFFNSPPLFAAVFVVVIQVQRLHGQPLVRPRQFPEIHKHTRVCCVHVCV